MARLDTHVVVWLHAAPERLSRTAATIVNSDDELVVSPIVRLELDLLHEVGRIASPAEPVLRDLSTRIGLRESAIDLVDVVRAAHDLTWTRDPFDRLIVADAIAASQTLVTRDRDIHRHFADARW